MDRTWEKVVEGYREELLAMARAGLESVYWRQDRYPTGGIVESDERVDGGRKLYWPWCWPRTHIVEPLIAVGQFHRVERFLDFWIECQRPDGNWLHCYDVRDHREYPGWPETDNVGYMLWHFGAYVKAAGDEQWLGRNWSHIESAARFLEENYRPEICLIWGQEEANLPGRASHSIRYSLHINCVCALGLLSAGDLAERRGDTTAAHRWREMAESILDEGIAVRLWDAEKRTFAWGLGEDGKRLTAPGLWMTLMPFWLFDRFDGRLDDTLAYLRTCLYDRDPKIPKTYWFYDFSPVLDAGKELVNQYSGYGVAIGGLPVLAHALVKADQGEHAREQLEKIVEHTSKDNGLIPDHVNTLTPGKIGDYSIYPEGQYRVDSGNLLHLSFFLTLTARHEPGVLRRASEEAMGGTDI